MIRHNTWVIKGDKTRSKEPSQYHIRQEMMMEQQQGLKKQRDQFKEYFGSKFYMIWYVNNWR